MGLESGYVLGFVYFFGKRMNIEYGVVCGVFSWMVEVKLLVCVGRKEKCLYYFGCLF